MDYTYFSEKMGEGGATAHHPPPPASYTSAQIEPTD